MKCYSKKPKHVKKQKDFERLVLFRIIRPLEQLRIIEETEIVLSLSKHRFSANIFPLKENVFFKSNQYIGPGIQEWTK